MIHRSLLIFAALLGVATAEFGELADVPQNIEVVQTNPRCSSTSWVPNAMVTVQPSATVTVSASPPNLVKLSTRSTGGTLVLDYNDDVASSAQEGGIVIGLPAGQLKGVIAASGIRAQIENGFTSIDKIDVSGGSNLIGDLSSNVMPFILSLIVSGGSGATVKSGGTIKGGNISGGSNAHVSAPTFNNPDVSGGSRLFINGDLSGGVVSGGSRIAASGDASGTTASGGSNIYAASCGSDVNVNGGSSCKASSPTVNVDVTQEPTTLTGNRYCWVWGSSARPRGALGAVAMTLVSGLVALAW